jgi:hypothetical protein
MQDLVAAASGTQGYTVNMGGPGSLVLTRKYTPTWAIVLAVIGFLIFLLGLLFLLVKNTETVTISLRPAPGGTEVRATGVATPELQARLNSVFEARSTGPLPAPSPPLATEAAAHAGDQQSSDAPSGSVEERLVRLEKMKTGGLVTDAEYEEQRARLLDNI